MRRFFLLIIFGLFFIPYSFAETENNEVRFITEGFAPYQIVDNSGHLVGGFSYALIKSLTERVAIQAKFEVMPWARAYKTVLSEPNTFLFSVIRSRKREGRFLWVGKIKQVHFHFYGLADLTPIDPSKPESLFLHTVAAVRGSIELEFLKQMGFRAGKNLIVTENYDAAWRMLKINRAQLVYGDEFEVESVANLFGVSTDQLSIKHTLNQSLDLYLVANRNSSRVLVKKMQDEFSQLIREGVIDELITSPELWLAKSKPRAKN